MEADIKREAKPRLAIGAGIAYNQKTNRPRSTFGSPYPVGEFTYLHVGGDLMFKWHGFYLSEAMLRNADANRRGVGDIDGDGVNDEVFARPAWGTFVQAGQMLRDHLELSVRFGHLKPLQGNKDAELGCALSYYLREHNLKLQGDYFYLSASGFNYDPIRPSGAEADPPGAPADAAVLLIQSSPLVDGVCAPSAGLAGEVVARARTSVEHVPERVDPPSLLFGVTAVIVIVVPDAPRWGVLQARRDLLELTRGAGDELLELAAVEPHAATARAHIDEQAVAITLLQDNGLATGTIHDTLRGLGNHVLAERTRSKSRPTARPALSTAMSTAEYTSPLRSSITTFK